MDWVPVGDHSNNNVQHDEGTQEDEGDEVDVGDDGAAPLLRVGDVQLPVLGVVPAVRPPVARSPGHGRHHDVRPRLARRASEHVRKYNVRIIIYVY